jgi:hypothetical protein
MAPEEGYTHGLHDTSLPGASLLENSTSPTKDVVSSRVPPQLGRTEVPARRGTPTISNR